MHVYKATLLAAGRAQSSNTQTAEDMRHGAQLLQLRLAALINELKKTELENILSSEQGALFLKHAAQAGCKLILGQPRVQASLQRRLLGPTLETIFFSASPWLMVPRESSWRDARAVVLIRFVLELLVVHPFMLVACSLYPPFKDWLEGLDVGEDANASRN